MTMAACLTTGPVTMAGNLAVGNAEEIAATALLQLAFPGAPVFYAAAQTASDLRLGCYTGSGPEDQRRDGEDYQVCGKGLVMSLRGAIGRVPCVFWRGVLRSELDPAKVAELHTFI